MKIDFLIAIVVFSFVSISIIVHGIRLSNHKIKILGCWGKVFTVFMIILFLIGMISLIHSL